MKRPLLAMLVVALAAAVPLGTAAKNGAPSGAHYTLNIIGVPKAKTASMSNSNRHVIFVPETGSAKINLTQGDFAVLDGNGTDGTAAFRLPAPDPDGDGWTKYSVYARALGKPGGSAAMTSCATDATGTWCSTEQLLLVRASGKSSFTNVSKQLLTVCMDTDGNGTCDKRLALFNDSTKAYYWQYDNTGLKLAQLRFYMIPTEVGTTP